MNGTCNFLSLKTAVTVRMGSHIARYIAITSSPLLSLCVSGALRVPSWKVGTVDLRVSSFKEFILCSTTQSRLYLSFSKENVTSKETKVFLRRKVSETSTLFASYMITEDNAAQAAHYVIYLNVKIVNTIVSYYTSRRTNMPESVELFDGLPTL